MGSVCLHGNIYASILVIPTALAALYVVAMFGSTAPPCNNLSAAIVHSLAILKVLPSHTPGYSHEV